MADGSNPIPEAFKRADELIRELTSDPELGAQVRARVKAKYSDVSFVEDRIDPAMSAMAKRLEEESAARKALEESIAKRDQESADAKRTADMQSSLEKARADYRLTPEGFDLMVQRMKDTGNYTDAEAAAAWAASKNPVVKEPSKAYLGPQTADFFGSAQKDENWELLHKNPERFLDAEMQAFVNDPDAYVREAGF